MQPSCFFAGWYFLAGNGKRASPGSKSSLATESLSPLCSLVDFTLKNWRTKKMLDDFVKKAFSDAISGAEDEQERAYNSLTNTEIIACFHTSCIMVGWDAMESLLDRLSNEQRDLLATWGNFMLMAGFHLGFDRAKLSGR